MKERHTSLKIAALASLTVVVLALIFVAGFGNQRELKTVNGQGIAEVMVVPDEITIHFTVESTGKTSQEANDAHKIVLDRTIAALMTLGYAREEITTSNFNIWEDFDWSSTTRTSRGFKATHTLEVIAGDFDIATIIDAGVGAGALISYIDFGLSVEAEQQYKVEALKAATEDATTKARAIAEGLNMKLGSLVSVENSDFGYYGPWVGYSRDTFSEASVSVAKESLALQPSSRAITAQVLVVYKLN